MNASGNWLPGEASDTCCDKKNHGYGICLCQRLQRVRHAVKRSTSHRACNSYNDNIEITGQPVISFNDEPIDEFGYDKAISICVSAIIRGLTRDEYLASVPAELLNESDNFFELIQAEDRFRIAALLARQIWSTCPIPAKGYHLDPLPKPKRNDRCPCGSGLKYKQCCRNLPPLPFDKVPMWSYLLDLLSAKQLHEALASNQIPLELYAEIGVEWIDDGEPTKAVRLLEPLFEQGQKINPRLGFAMNVLCDAFDELGHTNKKTKFLQRIADSNTGVSGDAWQRLATVLMDLDDLEGAAEAFTHAMRSHPDDPNLATLEVLLMIRQGKDNDHIRGRIRFWMHKLRRLGLDDGPIMALLEEAEDDPHGALSTGIEPALDPAFTTLRQWITDVLRPRKLPAYNILTMAPQEEDALDGSQSHLPDVLQGVLEQPPEVLEIERSWLEVFPAAKPFSTQTVHHHDAWAQTEWLTFLQQHEQAADSLSILDDLVAILEGFPEIYWIGIADGVFAPIYDRARDILLAAIDNAEKDITLPWPFMENRSALRLLFQRAMHRSGVNAKEDKRDLEELIKINPGDNHGIRSLLIDEYLRGHDDNKAIELAKAYPQDMLVDIKFGRILAEYRLDHKKEAEALLRKAHYEQPLVARTLWRKKVKQPQLDPDRVVAGGEDEAYFYRQDMRDEWESTPGALAWIRKITK